MRNDNLSLRPQPNAHSYKLFPSTFNPKYKKTKREKGEKAARGKITRTKFTIKTKGLGKIARTKFTTKNENLEV